MAQRLRPSSFSIMGYPIKSLRPVGISVASFAAVAGGTVLFILEGVPRVQKDILQKLPLIGSYWTGREKPASDNPF
ncbi:hypothetical protein C7212DRAFT_330093 [Tuber magnatum]|uniref:Uncharacterized protein n=1 Tax=Tuber magnatum TaxID=42249 RepID=A0A317SIC8_9PEZI|nr:hypothetical protein C7212DRAFT_330093 [Tuber magnatum]